MTETVEELRGQFDRRRAEIPKLADNLRSLTETARYAFAYKGVPVRFTKGEFSILLETEAGRGALPGWKGSVVDSVVLAMVLGDLLEAEEGGLAPAGGGGSRAALPAFIEMARRVEEELRRAKKGAACAAPPDARTIESCEERLGRLIERANPVAEGGSIETFLAPALGELRRLTKSLEGGAAAVGVHTVGGTVRTLTQPEAEAIHPEDEPGAEPVATLLAIAASATFKAGRDLGLLSLPEGVREPQGVATDSEKAVDLDVLKLLSRFLEEVISFAQLHSDRPLLEILHPVHRRVHELLMAGNNVLGEARARFRVRSFTLPVAAGDFVQKKEAKAPAGRGWAARAAAIARRALPHAIVVTSLLLIGSAVAYGVYLARHAEKLVPPRPFSVEDLAPYLPGASIVVSGDRAERTGRIRIQIGREWSQFSREEQGQRLFLACEFLAAHAYETAEFLDLSGDVFARWQGGRIWFVEAGAAEEERR